MKCIFCGCDDLKVIDSRPVDELNAIRRRRECNSCGKRFTTYETIETTPILVVKSDGSRQQLDMNKIKNGIIKSCEKRPVSVKEIDELVANIEKQIYNSLEPEISSKTIGEMVMSGLKQLDDVAYIRFASVYRQFKDSNSFLEELKKMLENK
jgi:transcriptional repressor NrdR